MNLSLFDLEPMPSYDRHPYARNSDTSKAAAHKAVWFSSKQGEVLYQHILRCGEFGSTDKESEIATGISRASLCARRKGLAGRIQDSGIRRDGCAAWIVVGL